MEDQNIKPKLEFNWKSEPPVFQTRNFQFPNPEVPVFGSKTGDSQAKAMVGAWRHGGGGVPASEARDGGKEGRGGSSRVRRPPCVRKRHMSSASGGARRRRAFLARVANEPEEKEVGDVD